MFPVFSVLTYHRCKQAQTKGRLRTPKRCVFAAQSHSVKESQLNTKPDCFLSISKLMLTFFYLVCGLDLGWGEGGAVVGWGCV